MNIYNKRDVNEQDGKLLVVPKTSIAWEVPAKHVADKRIYSPETKPTSKTQQMTLDGNEYRMLGLLQGNGLFDLSGQNATIKCQQNSCRSKLFYRRDLTRFDIEKFMVAVQDSSTSDYMKKNGIEVEGMTFGTDDESNRPYFEIFTKDVNQGK